MARLATFWPITGSPHPIYDPVQLSSILAQLVGGEVFTDGAYPGMTGDLDRWPDVLIHGNYERSGEAVNNLCEITDEDLRTVINNTFTKAINTPEGAWAFANVVDACVDEQTRRRGLTPPVRPPRKKTAP